jgi:hypothetical protein
MTTPTNTPSAKALIAEVQTLMLRLGFKGQADGSMGTITLTALKAILTAVVKAAETQAPKLITPPPAPPAPPYVRPVRAGAKFERIVKHYEGFSKMVYMIDGKLHGGWGHQLYGNTYSVGDTVSTEVAQNWFNEDRHQAEDRLNKILTGRVNQDQYDVLCSIVWNGGNYDDPANKKDAPIFYHSKFGVLIEAVNDERWLAASQIIVALGDKPTSTGKVYRGIANRRITEDEAFRGIAFKLR